MKAKALIIASITAEDEFEIPYLKNFGERLREIAFSFGQGVTIDEKPGRVRIGIIYDLEKEGIPCKD